jgi:hypothetical protein
MLRGLGWGHKYADGEDRDEREALNTNINRINLDITIISKFTKLRILERNYANLNGIYPSLFNFPLLQKSTISNCDKLKWDLEMVERLPSLKELSCHRNPMSFNSATGNIKSLRVINDTLERLNLNRCRNIEGDFMDLADFPCLKVLHLSFTAVRGGSLLGINDDQF